MSQFRRFAVAMEFVAIGVLDQVQHRAVGLASWRLANHIGSDVSAAIEATRRAEAIRRRAGFLGESALCLERSRQLARQSRLLLAL